MGDVISGWVMICLGVVGWMVLCGDLEPFVVWERVILRIIIFPFLSVLTLGGIAVMVGGLMRVIG